MRNIPLDLNEFNSSLHFDIIQSAIGLSFSISVSISFPCGNPDSVGSSVINVSWRENYGNDPEWVNDCPWLFVLQVNYT